MLLSRERESKWFLNLKSHFLPISSHDGLKKCYIKTGKLNEKDLNLPQEKTFLKIYREETGRKLLKNTFLLPKVKNNPHLPSYNGISQKVEYLNKFSILNKFHAIKKKFFRYSWKISWTPIAYFSCHNYLKKILCVFLHCIRF